MTRSIIVRSVLPCLQTLLLLFLWADAGPGALHAQKRLPDSLMAHYYRLPVDVLPPTLAGSCGEFRANHFHAGLDFRVGGYAGPKVYAVAPGYVSRISISPGGYGNCLYLNHPNGTTSVYAHLDRFVPALQNYVREVQYARESFALDLSLAPEAFPVDEGEVIAYVGNSGGSVAAHLHFELRETSTQAALNISQYPVYSFADNYGPIFRRVYFYAYRCRRGLPQTRLIKEADISRPLQAVAVSDTFYIAMDGYDKMDGTYSKMGIDRYEVLLDGEKVFVYRAGDVAFEDTRYINALFQYDQYAQRNRMMLKTYMQPGNALTALVEAPTRGLFTLPADGLTHRLEVRLCDFNGNVSVRQFDLRRGWDKWPSDAAGTSAAGASAAGGASDEGVAPRAWSLRLYWDRESFFQVPDLKLALRKGSLYDNTLLQVVRLHDTLWQLGSEHLALHRPAPAAFHWPGLVPPHLESKVALARLTRDGDLRYVGGTYQGGWLTASLPTWGRYTYALDTLPPRVKPLFASGANLRGRASLVYVIQDSFSGIASYRVEIDGAWTLGIYDAKYARLTCPLDSKRLAKGRSHRIKIRVVDNRGNVTENEQDFFW